MATKYFNRHDRDRMMVLALLISRYSRADSVRGRDETQPCNYYLQELEVMRLTTKEYLRSVLDANLELRSKEDELATYRQDCYSVSAIDYSKDRVTGGVSTDISDKIAKLTELIQDVDKQWEKLIQLRVEANRLINNVEQSNLRVLLIQRYVLGKPWHEVADFMFISENHARGYLNGQAIQKFGKVNTD